MRCIASRAIGHRCRQIATDISQKKRQRILDPLRARRASGSGGRDSGWLACLRAGRWTVSDPVMPQAESVARAAQGTQAPFVAGVLGIRATFGADPGRDGAVGARLMAKVELLLEGRAA